MPRRDITERRSREPKEETSKAENRIYIQTSRPFRVCSSRSEEYIKEGKDKHINEWLGGGAGRSCLPGEFNDFVLKNE
jgi:hypothetical protein